MRSCRAAIRRRWTSGSTLRDALLVRVDKKIKIRRVRTGLYPTTTPLFAGLVTARRGWVLADATVGGRTFRVITTHLESFNDTSQVAQGQELAQGPAATSLPDDPARRPQLTR